MRLEPACVWLWWDRHRCPCSCMTHIYRATRNGHVGDACKRQIAAYVNMSQMRRGVFCVYMWHAYTCALHSRTTMLEGMFVCTSVCAVESESFCMASVRFWWAKDCKHALLFLLGLHLLARGQGHFVPLLSSFHHCLSQQQRKVILTQLR